MKKDPSSNAAIVTAIITGVIAIIAACIGILPDLLDRMPKASPTPQVNETAFANTPLPTEVLQPTATMPADTAEPIPTETVSAGLPVGYVTYDDFISENSLKDNWLVDDPRKTCDLSARSGFLVFDCLNKTKNNLQATLLASKRFVSISGAAAQVSVIESGGPLQLTTRWKCASENTERAYHLALDTHAVTASEFYPLEDWREAQLGTVSVSAGQPHILQIEASGGQIAFLVDGQPLSFTGTPDFSACLSMDSWGFAFLVWQDNNSILGQAAWTGVRP
jgi:hypothetical protein